jgi:hypothetical protein
MEVGKMGYLRSLFFKCAVAVLLLSTGCVHQAEIITVETGRYRLIWDSTTSVLRLEAPDFPEIGIREIKLAQKVFSAEPIERNHPVWGMGRGLKLTQQNGRFTEFTLFDGLLFLAVQSGVKNETGEQLQIDKFPVLEAVLDFGKPAEELISRGTAGLKPVDEQWGSYVFNAIGDPETGSGVVFGWVTAERGQGIVFPVNRSGAPAMRTRVDYGDLRLPPGSSEKGELLLIGIFEDVRTGLERYADATAEHLDIKLRPVPGVYCTWYHSGASTAERIAANTDFAADNLKPFGLSVMQIDDFWQAGIKENGPKKVFDRHDPQGPYPDGMKATADHIRSKGMVPGLWFMPFSGAWYDPFFADKQDIFYKTGTGDTNALVNSVLKPLGIEPGRPLSEYPYSMRWSGTAIDCTNPKAQEYVRQMVSRIAHEWGYKYFKMDGFHSGIASVQKYVDNEYREDDLGKPIRHNPLMTPIEGYRIGQRILREAAGDDVFFLACCMSQTLRSFGTTFGMVDAMRIGPDNGPDGPGFVRGATYGTRFYFLNKRVWHCDPDPIYVRPSVPRDRAVSLASFVTLAGQLNATSYQYAELPPDRLDIIKRSLPTHNSTDSRPVDFLQKDLSSIWLLKDDRSGVDRTVVGFFNWDEFDPATHSVELEKLDLDPAKHYVGFDYWADRFVGPQSGKLTVSLGGGQCRIISLYSEKPHPQLVSTSRHITQGIVDVISEQWDGKGTLSGTSRMVAGDPYELRIAVPAGAESWKVQSASVEGIRDVNCMQDGPGVRVSFVSEKTGTLNWTVQFARGAVKAQPMKPQTGFEAENTAWTASLKWDDVPGATGYLLTRSDGKAGEHSFLLNDTAFVDTTVELKKNYTYEVRPLDWNGNPGEGAVLTVAMPEKIEKPATPPKPELPLKIVHPRREPLTLKPGEPYRFGRDGKLVCPIPKGAKRFVANVAIDPEACEGREIVFMITSDVKEMGEPPVMLARSETLSPEGLHEWSFNLELNPRARDIWIECRAVKGNVRGYQATALDAGFLK